MKSLFPRIADFATGIVVLALGLGIVWSGSSLYWAELHTRAGVPIENSILIIAILAAVALISGYTSYRFLRNALYPAK